MSALLVLLVLVAAGFAGWRLAVRALAVESHLDPEFAEKWFNFVVAEVIHHHVRAGAAPTAE